MPRRPLNEMELRYAQRLWELIREATQTCSAASRDWNELNQMLDVKLDGDGISDIVVRARTKEANIPLQAAFSKTKFWQQEVLRLSAALESMKTIRELECWGEESDAERPGSAGVLAQRRAGS